MSRIAKNLIFILLYYSGLSWLRSKFLNDKIFCIGYHSIWSVENKELLQQNLYHNISISAEKFEKQMLFLKNNGHNFIHFSDLKKPEMKKLSKPTIIFFDDGFKDVLVNALPILKRHNIPATIFITTGLLGRSHFLWTLELRHFLLKNGYEESNIEKKVAELKRLKRAEREETMTKMFSETSFVLNPSDFNIFLSWPELLELSRNNFEVGSHGVIHQKFTELDSAELRREFFDSRSILEEKVGVGVKTISYPYGRVSGELEKIAQSAGYDFGVSTIIGLNDFESIRRFPFRLKKIDPELGSLDVCFKVKLYINI